MALYSEEIDGIHGYCSVRLVDMGNGTERIRLEHRVTTDQMPASEWANLPRAYMPHRVAGVAVDSRRIVEFVDVPRGRYIPQEMARELVKKHLGQNTEIEWLGRGWAIHSSFSTRRAR
jgi:hypothetical protein